MKPFLLSLMLVVSVVSLMLQRPAVVRAQDTPSLAGLYACEGQNPDGEPYTGTVEIIATGATLHLRWTLQPNNAQVVGVGLHVGTHVAFSYVLHGRPGIVVYDVQGMTLTGRWTVGGADKIWVETLKRLPNDHPPPAQMPTPQRNTPKRQAGRTIQG